MKENKNLSEEIEIIQKRINMVKNGEESVVHICDDVDKNECALKDENAWFSIGEDKQLHTLVSLESLNRLIGSLKAAQEENFHLKLEKTIWKYVPVDFGDAWAVAMDEVEALSKKEPSSKALNINLNHLVKDIKKKHPNLFLNIDDFLPGDFKQLS